MDEFMGLTKNMFFEKWKNANWIIGIDFLALIVIYLMQIVRDGFSNMVPNYFFALFIFSLVIVNIVGIVMFARSNERVLTSNNYRLIPTSATKLYFTNLLTTFISFIYLWILESVVGGIVYALSGINHQTMSFAGINTTEDWGMAGRFYLFLILSIILIWSAITLIHLLASWISSFLPFGKQKFVTFILYLVVIWLSSVIFNFTTSGVFKLLYNFGTGRVVSISSFNSIMNVGSGISFAWIAIFTVVNIYLLKRWTETKR